MKFFYRLEYKYGKYAISNLMLYIVIMYAAGLAIQYTNPQLYWQWLSLDAEMILKGQVWRLVTFMIYPPTTSVFFAVIMLYMYYVWGRTMERVWGPFRFNVYFFLGVIGHIVAALVGYLVFEESWYLTTGYLNFSLFFVYAMNFPNQTILLNMILPIKAKWLAIAEAAVYLFSFINGNASTRCEILVSMLNVLLFAVLTIDRKRLNPKIKIQNTMRKKKFRDGVKVLPPGQAIHRCSTCGKTEKDDPDLEFRYCSKCEGNYEYCQEHLYTHEHVMKH